jgi:TRAP-type C4-dicarboxylate transport system substrate-binding protein
LKRMGSFIFSGFVAFSFLLCASVWGASPNAPAPIKWRMQTSAPSTSLMQQHYQKFCDEIGRRSSGRLVVETHPDYGLGYKLGDSLAAIKDGLLEAVQDYSSHWSGTLPIFGAANLPFFYKSDEDRVKGLKALFPLYDRELNKMNAKLLMLEGLPLVQLFSRTPITKVEDFKGKKIRVSAKPPMAVLTRLGASPQGISITEAITALQTGVLDGQVWSLRAGLSYKIQDVVHYVSSWPFYGVENATIVNVAAFNKLPADLKKVVEDVSQDVEKELIKNVLLGEKADYDEMKATGKMNFLQPEKDSLERVRTISKAEWEIWAKGAGPSARAAIDAIEKTLGK